MPIEEIVKLLNEIFKDMVKTFEKDDWKFYKFGRGGPYKRTLTHLQKMAQKYDQIIFDHFGLHEEIASFGKLTVLSLSVAKTHKDRYKNIATFRRQIQRMKKII